MIIQKKHPAKFSKEVLDEIAPYFMTGPDWKFLDPFAGSGKLKEIAVLLKNVYLNEIEPEWAVQGKPCNVTIADTLYLPYADEVFDCIITSPVYGNRMSDHYRSTDNSKRFTYKHYLERSLNDRNSGKLKWGESYKFFHMKAWNECDRVLRDDGMFILNVSNHIRNGEEMKVSEFHLNYLTNILNYGIIKEIKVKTKRMRMGANNQSRVLFENIFVLKKRKIQ